MKPKTRRTWKVATWALAFGVVLWAVTVWTLGALFGGRVWAVLLIENGYGEGWWELTFFIAIAFSLAFHWREFTA